MSESERKQPTNGRHVIDGIEYDVSTEWGNTEITVTMKLTKPIEPERLVVKEIYP